MVILPENFRIKVNKKTTEKKLKLSQVVQKTVEFLQQFKDQQKKKITKNMNETFFRLFQNIQLYLTGTSKKKKCGKIL